jgi:pimeloyl-ACP methyl ester carboxylesterase
MGNDGKLMRRRVDVPDGKAGLHKTIGTLLADNPDKDVVIHVHGGLNTEKEAIRRAQVLGPWFEANGIVPIFVVWRTGFMQSVGNIGADLVSDYLHAVEQAERSGILDLAHRIRDRLKRKFDSAFEAAAEQVLGKAVWSQIKQNAQAACQHTRARHMTGGMRQLADLIKAVQSKQEAPLRVHLIGHSAGSILLGHFARDLARFTRIGSLSLLAPACSVGFANSHFRPLVEKGHLPADKLFIANLNRSNERNDTVGPYNKSLLYLVSRALEVPRKMPLLGLDDSWILPQEVTPTENTHPSISADLLADDDRHKRAIFDALSPYYTLSDIKTLHAIGALSDARKQAAIRKLSGVEEIFQWRKFMAQSNLQYLLHQDRNALVRDIGNRQKHEPITHGNIDNDIRILNQAVLNMIGQMSVPITDLTGG